MAAVFDFNDEPRISTISLSFSCYTQLPRRRHSHHLHSFIRYHICCCFTYNAFRSISQVVKSGKMRISFIFTTLVVVAGAVDPLGEISCSWSSCQQLKTVVDLACAKYQGQTLQNGVNQWLSLRFAAPSTGALRFSAAQAPLTKNTTQDATKVNCV